MSPTNFAAKIAIPTASRPGGIVQARSTTGAPRTPEAGGFSDDARPTPSARCAPRDRGAAIRTPRPRDPAGGPERDWWLGRQLVGQAVRMPVMMRCARRLAAGGAGLTLMSNTRSSATMKPARSRWPVQLGQAFQPLSAAVWRRRSSSPGCTPSGRKRGMPSISTTTSSRRGSAPRGRRPGPGRGRRHGAARRRPRPDQRCRPPAATRHRGRPGRCADGPRRRGTAAAAGGVRASSATDRSRSARHVEAAGERHDAGTGARADVDDALDFALVWLPPTRSARRGRGRRRRRRGPGCPPWKRRTRGHGGVVVTVAGPGPWLVAAVVMVAVLGGALVVAVVRVIHSSSVSAICASGISSCL